MTRGVQQRTSALPSPDSPRRGFERTQTKIGNEYSAVDNTVMDVLVIGPKIRREQAYHNRRWKKSVDRPTAQVGLDVGRQTRGGRTAQGAGGWWSQRNGKIKHLQGRTDCMQACCTFLCDGVGPCVQFRGHSVSSTKLSPSPQEVALLLRELVPRWGD